VTLSTTIGDAVLDRMADVGILSEAIGRDLQMARRSILSFEYNAIE
jgi:hypothetical protein